MLPDFPRTKGDLYRMLRRRISDLEKQQNPVLAQIRTFTQHEGVTIQFEQVDYGKKTQQAEEQYVSVEIRFDEVPTLIGEALDKKLRDIADQRGRLKMKSMFHRINEAAEQTGNKLDAAGKPMSGRMLLDMIDIAETGFDKSGK